MIDRILEFSLRQRAFVLFATLLLLGVGIWSAVRPCEFRCGCLKSLYA